MTALPFAGALVGAEMSGLHWWADPARHDYRPADADRPEDGCARCGYLADMHPDDSALSVTPGSGQWRVGQHYGIHIYEGDRPVATFHRPEDAKRAVAAVNGQPGDPFVEADLEHVVVERDKAIAELRALVEAVSRGDHVLPPAYRRAREYVRALDGGA